jgi:hypothetical protein
VGLDKISPLGILIPQFWSPCILKCVCTLKNFDFVHQIVISISLFTQYSTRLSLALTVYAPTSSILQNKQKQYNKHKYRREAYNSRSLSCSPITLVFCNVRAMWGEIEGWFSNWVTLRETNLGVLPFLGSGFGKYNLPLHALATDTRSSTEYCAFGIFHTAWDIQSQSLFFVLPRRCCIYWLECLKQEIARDVLRNSQRPLEPVLSGMNPSFQRCLSNLYINS